MVVLRFAGWNNSKYPYIEIEIIHNNNIRIRNLGVNAHPSCPPKVNVFCHAGTRFVKVETLYFVRAADAPGKTKAINLKDGIFPIVYRVDAVFAFT